MLDETMAKLETGDCEFWLPDDLFFGEDDFIPIQGLGPPLKETTELTKGLPDFFLSEHEKPTSMDDNSKDTIMAGSPQSTLCANGFLSASGGESPNGPAQVSSPPPSNEKENREKETLDMLFEAAGQVMRLKLNEEERIKPQNIPIPSPKPSPLPHANNGFFPNQSISHKQIQAAQFHYLRQQQMMKQQQFTNALLWDKQRNRKCGPPLGLPQSAWPPLTTPHQPPAPPAAAAGMRAVFLAGTKKESAGTGVFLPKRPGSPTHPRKKSACSTVLLPARVVQALNLNLDELGAPARCTGGYVLDHDAMIGRSNAMNMNKKRINGSEMQQNRIRKSMERNEEICLPKEWTY
ncbi:hypothetical protein LUZ60_015253 [Juncus effusus]|nr:hypothetical protein LUZ60_015253 [Juncus effusus]